MNIIFEKKFAALIVAVTGFTSLKFESDVNNSACDLLSERGSSGKVAPERLDERADELDFARAHLPAMSFEGSFTHSTISPPAEKTDNQAKNIGSSTGGAVLMEASGPEFISRNIDELGSGHGIFDSVDVNLSQSVAEMPKEGVKEFPESSKTRDKIIKSKESELRNSSQDLHSSLVAGGSSRIELGSSLDPNFVEIIYKVGERLSRKEAKYLDAAQDPLTYLVRETVAHSNISTNGSTDVSIDDVEKFEAIVLDPGSSIVDRLRHMRDLAVVLSPERFSDFAWSIVESTGAGGLSRDPLLLRRTALDCISMARDVSEGQVLGNEQAETGLDRVRREVDVYESLYRQSPDDFEFNFESMIIADLTLRPDGKQQEGDRFLREVGPAGWWRIIFDDSQTSGTRSRAAENLSHLLSGPALQVLAEYASQQPKIPVQVADQLWTWYAAAAGFVYQNPYFGLGANTWVNLVNHPASDPDSWQARTLQAIIDLDGASPEDRRAVFNANLPIGALVQSDHMAATRFAAALDINQLPREEAQGTQTFIRYALRAELELIAAGSNDSSVAMALLDQAGDSFGPSAPPSPQRNEMIDILRLLQDSTDNPALLYRLELIEKKITENSE